MHSILVIEDDFTSRSLIESVLRAHGYHVDSFESPSRGLSELKNARYDLILSDYFMPEMNGDQVLKEVRSVDREIPFLFLTANTDVKVAVELVRAGADDYIVKPIVGEQLLFRIDKTLEAKKRERLIRRVEQERELLELERRQLTRWRHLYASKDITQTEQMINLLSRTINQAGGFLWVDLLRGVLDESAVASDGSNVTVPVDRDVLEMVITAGTGQKEIFDYVTFIAGVETMPLDSVVVPISEFLAGVESQAAAMFGAANPSQDRSFQVMRSAEDLSGAVSVDRELLSQVLHEVLVNAIKYSPSQGRIVLGAARNRESNDYLDITVSNTARPADALDNDGQPVLGIPYDFSELVFDLFYTIDAFQTELPEERWGYGTGLYVVRKLAKRHGGWVSAGNGVDYTTGTPETMVRVTVTLPITKEG